MSIKIALFALAALMCSGCGMSNQQILARHQEEARQQQIAREQQSQHAAAAANQAREQDRAKGYTPTPFSLAIIEGQILASRKTKVSVDGLLSGNRTSMFLFEGYASAGANSYRIPLIIDNADTASRSIVYRCMSLTLSTGTPICQHTFLGNMEMCLEQSIIGARRVPCLNVREIR